MKRYESRLKAQAHFQIPGHRAFGLKPALEAFHGEGVVELVAVAILFLQKQLVDGQGTDGPPGVIHVLKDWLRERDGQLDKLGSRQGRGWRLVLQGRGRQRGEGLRPWEVSEGRLVLRTLQLRPHGGRGSASCLGRKHRTKG